jgi:hypothetical protein
MKTGTGKSTHPPLSTVALGLGESAQNAGQRVDGNRLLTIFGFQWSLNSASFSLRFTLSMIDSGFPVHLVYPAREDRIAAAVRLSGERP